MREKQKIKRSYMLLETQFKRTFDEATRLKGVTGENMLVLLERRLDNVIYRLGFASSRLQARQFVQHGHVIVNSKRVDIPSYQVKVNDIVEIKEDFKTNTMLEDAIKLSKAVGSVPQWLEVDYEKRNGKIIRLPERKDIEPIFNEQVVVELYSK